MQDKDQTIHQLTVERDRLIIERGDYAHQAAAASAQRDKLLAALEGLNDMSWLDADPCDNLYLESAKKLAREALEEVTK